MAIDDNGGLANIRNTNFKLTANGNGGFNESTVTGQAANLNNKLQNQAVGPNTYSVSGDATGTVVATYDDPSITDLQVQIERYPELVAALRTNRLVLVPDVMREPIFVGGQECFVTASVGIAMFPRDGVTKGDLAEYYAEIGAVIVPHLRDRPFTLVDTGGLFGHTTDPLHDMVVEHGLKALAEADLIVFVLDAREGLVPGDGPVCAVLAGGNIDATTLMSVTRYGLTSSGRHLVVRIVIPEVPVPPALIARDPSGRTTVRAVRVTSALPPTSHNCQGEASSMLAAAPESSSTCCPIRGKRGAWSRQ
jgi:hypothetical protein